MQFIEGETMFNIFIANLGKYNEGELVGKWLKLPCDSISKELAAIGVKRNSEYEEAFISDYENDWDYEVSEYENISELNELVKILVGIEKTGDKKWFLAYCEAYGENFKEAAQDNKYQDSCFYGEKSIKDIATEEITSAIFDNVKDIELAQTLVDYFDYESYAEELSMGSYYETNHGTIYIH